MRRRQGTRGSAHLAGVVSQMIERQAHRAQPTTFAYGTIRADMALVIDTFSVPIPQAEYRVVDHLRLPDPMTTTSAAGEGPHTHNVPVPNRLRPLGPGDRVVVLIEAGDAPDIMVIGRFS